MLDLFLHKGGEQIVRSVEFQIVPGAKILSKAKTLGDLRHQYPKIEFVKYIYVDPEDGLLKGVNPSDDIPLVKKANLTIAGNLNSIIKLSKLATSK